MSRLPFVSIIIPCRNEEGFIGRVLKNILNQDYPGDKFEILVIDGDSDDNTVVEVERISKIDERISLLRNEKRIVPTALNIGIEHAKGDIIVRLDAHCEYPSNYLLYLVSEQQKLDAENVGVAVKTVPGNNSTIAQSIAYALSSKFGMGDSHFRIGVKERMEVDTVPFGCFKRKVFDEIGLFDTDLVRNQDDEFNGRIIKNGGKIWILPNLVLTYYSRTKLSQVWLMFYQYGLFKPLVNKKLGSPATVRQFVPPLFVLSLVAILALSFISSWISLLLAVLVLIPYFVLSLLVSFNAANRQKKLALLFQLPIVFITIHLAYGLGYLNGIWKYLILNEKSASDLATNR